MNKSASTKVPLFGVAGLSLPHMPQRKEKTDKALHTYHGTLSGGASFSEECQKSQPPLLLKKGVAIPLQFVLQYFRGPCALRKGNTFNSSVLLPFALARLRLESQYPWETLLVGVTGMVPIDFQICAAERNILLVIVCRHRWLNSLGRAQG